MGAVTKVRMKVLSYIDIGKQEGATLIMAAPSLVAGFQRRILRRT